MEETTPTAIESLFTNVTDIISKIMTSLGDVCGSLLENPLFQLTIGIIVLFIVMGIVYKLVYKLRKGGR